MKTKLQIVGFNYEGKDNQSCGTVLLKNPAPEALEMLDKLRKEYTKDFYIDPFRSTKVIKLDNEIYLAKLVTFLGECFAFYNKKWENITQDQLKKISEDRQLLTEIKDKQLREMIMHCLKNGV